MNNELDLHGIKHMDVKNRIDKFLWENMKNEKLYAKIITGNSIIMKETVLKTLKDYNMTATESFFNSGILIINLV